MLFNLNMFKVNITSLIDIASNITRFYEEPFTELIERLLIDYRIFLDGEVDDGRVIESQIIMKGILENLHQHHRDVRSGYFFREFSRLVEVDSGNQELRKVI